jgi:hypothetical protein
LFNVEALKYGLFLALPLLTVILSFQEALHFSAKPYVSSGIEVRYILFKSLTYLNLRRLLNGILTVA